MRLITYDRGGARRLGAWVGDTVVDLPEAVGHPAFPPTMEALVRHIGGSILDAARDVLEDGDVVTECTVPRPRVLPALVPSTRPIRVVTEGGVVRTLQPGSFAAGLACIVGAGRARRLNRHEPRIFGYTLMAHWTNGQGGRSTTSVGPCVVTPEEVDEAVFDVHLRIDGEPCGVKSLEAPGQFFARSLAEEADERRFEAGDLLAWIGWRLGNSKTRANETPRAIELSAEPIGVLSSDRHAK